MKIGIIFALKEELEALLKVLTLKKQYEIFDLTFYECELDNTEIVLVDAFKENYIILIGYNISAEEDIERKKE